jgi:hypothetical protein
MIPNMLGWPVKWYGQAGRIEDLRAEPGLDAPAVAWTTVERVGVAG